MIKKKSFDVLKFPLPTELIKKDGKQIPGTFFSGFCVALAIRDRAYSTVHIMCSNDEAYEALKHLDKKKISFTPYTNVANFALNVTVFVIRSDNTIDYNGLNVCQVAATLTQVFAKDEDQLATNDVSIVGDKFELKELLALHNAGLNIIPALQQLKDKAGRII